ncbi:hypothetical protein [Streptomyces griseiscabiei]|uniref:Uncharacterized protein n=1 Tax=Streptomyces griseiscabiei TaxID=2993540 RepID=A0ABU4KYM5_9ACTN|nr:hypothetical protein [Streptomyces griseiscabiei]MBZ3904494.1 hypothetical protein [Streptomyces griseiscabiei]MDX2908243.1 hypothetical protein [Streptomyces griseiscabiei]
MESFFSRKRTGADGPRLPFVAVPDGPEYVAFTQAHHGLPTEHGRQVGTVQGVHYQLGEEEADHTVWAARKTAQHAAPATATMGPVRPGPSTVTVVINALVPDVVSAAPGLQPRQALRVGTDPGYVRGANVVMQLALARPELQLRTTLTDTIEASRATLGASR